MRRAGACVAMLGALACLGVGSLSLPSARAEPLLVDLSDHLVKITAGFVGTDVLVFGAISGPGDIVVVVKGPAKDLIVRKKSRVAGMWLNRDSLTFVRAPTFYSVAATRPLAEFVPLALLQRQGIGVEHLRLEERGAATEGEVAEFRLGLVRNKQGEGLYAREVAKIAVLAGGLFRADLSFPANVPTGAYTVEVYLIRDGDVASAQTTPLVVSNVGVGADVHFFAHGHAALYGVFAVLLALLAGWAASAAFRRG